MKNKVMVNKVMQRTINNDQPIELKFNTVSGNIAYIGNFHHCLCVYLIN